jgi:hypothetical protein
MRANLILPWAGALCGLALTLGACNDDSGPTAVKKATSDAVSGDASGDTVAADTAADSAVADVAVDAASDASASDATAGDTTLADATTASDATAADTAAEDMGSAGDTDDAADSVDAAPNCAGIGGCWSCKPTTSVQLLNLCTSNSCAPFDNKARLPLLPATGQLPPLP